MPRHMRVLNLEKQLKLLAWLKDNQTRLDGRPSTEMADMAAAVLGFEVSDASVKHVINAAGDDLKIRYGRSGKPRNIKGDGFTRDAELAKAVRYLAEQLGCELPNIDSLNAIVGRRTPESGGAE